MSDSAASPKPDARPMYRILALLVGLVTAGLVLWGFLADERGFLVAAMLIFFLLGAPMLRLATTGYFYRRK